MEEATNSNKQNLEEEEEEEDPTLEDEDEEEPTLEDDDDEEEQEEEATSSKMITPGIIRGVKKTGRAIYIGDIHPPRTNIAQDLRSAVIAKLPPGVTEEFVENIFISCIKAFINPPRPGQNSCSATLVYRSYADLIRSVGKSQNILIGLTPDAPKKEKIKVSLEPLLPYGPTIIGTQFEEELLMKSTYRHYVTPIEGNKTEVINPLTEEKLTVQHAERNDAKIKVSNLPIPLNTKEFKKFFMGFGFAKHAHVEVNPRPPHNQLTYGFVFFCNGEIAQNFLNKDPGFHPVVIKGKQVTITATENRPFGKYANQIRKLEKKKKNQQKQPQQQGFNQRQDDYQGMSRRGGGRQMGMGGGQMYNYGQSMMGPAAMNWGGGGQAWQDPRDYGYGPSSSQGGYDDYGDMGWSNSSQMRSPRGNRGQYRNHPYGGGRGMGGY